MGTRSKIEIYNEGKKGHLVTTYKQYDGYIDGLGLDIFNLLKGRQLVNGYSGDMTLDTNFNGMGELAAYLIKELKQNSMKKSKHVTNQFTKENKYVEIDSNQMGNFYIQTKTKDLEEYNYIITQKQDEIYLACYNWDNDQLFNSKVSELNEDILRGLAKKY